MASCVLLDVFQDTCICTLDIYFPSKTLCEEPMSLFPLLDLSDVCL